MFLLDLPPELLIIIINQLDIVSLNNVYGTCHQLRHLIGQFGNIKECNLSMSTLATGQSLKLDIFKDISRNVQDLNMCGINDLNKNILIPSISKLNLLKKLNISYTNLNIMDFLEIYQVCPTIKEVILNVTFFIDNPINITNKSLLQCQEVFKNLDAVNFFGNVSNLLYSRVPLFILSKAKLKQLQYTVMDCDMVTFACFDEEVVVPQFNNFCLNISGVVIPSRYCYPLGKLYFFTTLNFEDYEVMIIFSKVSLESNIYTTPLFIDFLKDNYDLNAICIRDFTVTLNRSACVMLWNKKLTQFDKNFFNDLLQMLKPILPFSFKSSVNAPVPSNYHWYCTTPGHNKDESTSYVNDLGVKRRRSTYRNYVINYDKQFERKHKLQLSLFFNGEIKSPIILSSDCQYLKKLTYLNLSGVVRYSAGFFNILFENCSQLVTLNVDIPPICSCFAAISRSLPLNHSLKNIRIEDRRIDFVLMFSSMSQCKALEKVIICDVSLNPLKLSDPYLMFQNCNNLYCLYVYGSVSDTAKSQGIQLLKKAKSKSLKSQLRVNVFSNKSLHYDPFIAVFQLNPIWPE